MYAKLREMFLTSYIIMGIQRLEGKHVNQVEAAHDPVYLNLFCFQIQLSTFEG